MEFFNFINSKISDGVQLNITIRKVGENLTMSIIPDTKAVKDKAVKDIEPLVLTGTANDFEKGFESAFAPVVNVIGLVSDVSEYEKNIEEARKKTEMETKKKKDAEANKKSFSDHIELAKLLFAEDKFKDAITVLDKASSINGSDLNAISKLRSKIEEKSSGGLFGGVEDKSDGKRLTPGSKPTSVTDDGDDNSNEEED